MNVDRFRCFTVSKRSFPCSAANYTFIAAFNPWSSSLPESANELKECSVKHCLQLSKYIVKTVMFFCFCTVCTVKAFKCHMEAALQ